ncbi:MATE family efflux transporter [Lederbergia lenta]|uniref:MATE type Na+-driven multidrug efflux pump n=1 Tax=Lederbergia lenta TaxID=1467 RepID=A0A2X4W8J7_LEDLE|nr:MATE family efflux transporter [Lederbergia lenta]MCM3110924.1 MATE family efflux transporter [Lederbergia lenta]MEC2325680.1 MATE family efflux transporter [Lederbergia lenta]SQI53970.1 MATE type Na+-driven multidrug efflux pump [Lederbergia lenta]
MSKETKKKLTLFALTWPIFIELLLHMLMGNADTLMLSQYSDQSVAAVGVSNQLLSLVIVMFGFISTGTAVLIAQNIGAKKNSTAKEVAVVSIALNLIFGLALSLLVFFFYKPILGIMDLPSELYEEAGIYLKIVGGFAFIQAIIMTIGAIVRSYGFTKDIMYITIGMNIINVIGNYLFIFGPFGIPVLGVEGVAISTTVSRFIGLIAAIIILFKRVPGKFPFQMLWRIPKAHIQNLLRIGVPSAGENLSYNASQMVITFFIAMLGTEALTSKVYVQNVTMFLMLFGMAIAQGTQIIVGHMIGGKELEQAYKRGLDSLRKAIIIAFFMAIAASIFSKGLLGIFTTNQDIIQTGSILIILSIILEPGRAFNMVLINALRAAGDVKFPVYIGIMSMWGVSVPLSYILGIYFEMGLIGVWIAFIADEWLRGILMLRRWKARGWLEKTRFFVA